MSHPCQRAGCYTPISDYEWQLGCQTHWARVPYLLKMDLRWAITDGQFYAAEAACITALNQTADV